MNVSFKKLLGYNSQLFNKTNKEILIKIIKCLDYFTIHGKWHGGLDSYLVNAHEKLGNFRAALDRENWNVFQRRS